MGQDLSMLVHICGMDYNNHQTNISQMNIINLIFKVENKKKSTYDYIVRTSKEPKWDAFIYKEQQNFSKVKETIKQSIEVAKKNNKNENYKVYKNNMILCFADNKCDELLCKEFNKTKAYFNQNFPLILFIFNNTKKTNRDYANIFFDITYIKCINLNDICSTDSKDSDKIKSLYLFSLLKKRYDSYFNEKGYKIIDEIDPISNLVTTGIYLPILLLGNPGMGKSTFINTIAGERVSKATSSVEPVTTKDAYYDIKILGNNDTNLGIDNDLLKQEAYIRFIDTPGFDQNKDIEITINAVEKIFKAFEQGKERIPVILYFLSSGRSFGNEKEKKKNTLKLLNYLQKKNSKIIFIVTHCTDDDEEWEQTPSFKEFLEENKLEKLVEKDNSNILTCNLVGKHAFGIKKIFQKIYSFLNIMENNEVYNESLIEGINQRKTFEEKLQFIKQKTRLFDEFQSQEDIIKYARMKSNALIGSFSILAAAAGTSPIPLTDLPVMVSLITTSIIKIGSFYGYVWKKISKNDIISILKGELYDKKKDENYTDTKDSKAIITPLIIFDIIKGLLLGSFITATGLLIDDAIKVIPIVGTIIGCITGATIDSAMMIHYGKNAKNYFETKCKTDDGTLFFCSRCYEYEIIFKKFKDFQDYDIIYPK